jgi:hypothetical protein
MKHLLLFFLSGTICFHVIAQEKETIQQFCFVRLQYQMFSKVVLIEIEDGTKYDTQSGYNKRLQELDSAGNPMKFKSPADALNYMGKKGWKLAEVLPRSSEITTTTYLFKREIMKEEAGVNLAKQ